MTFSTLTIWLIDFKHIDFWYIDKIHIWLFDTLTKETYDLLQGSPVVGIVVGTVVDGVVKTGRNEKNRMQHEINDPIWRIIE